jgi:hypothetical protein
MRVLLSSDHLRLVFNLDHTAEHGESLQEQWQKPCPKAKGLLRKKTQPYPGKPDKSWGRSQVLGTVKAV